MRMLQAIVLALFLFPGVTFAQDINAGFVQGLWYSHEPVFSGETVRVYAALRNNTDGDLTATVTFYDNGERFARRDVSALSGRLVEAWGDWHATYGEHTIRAELANIRIDTIEGSDTYADVASARAEDTLTIDHDTDGDGIGNAADEDDDNDGVPDEDEIEAGTDPLVPDAPETAEDEEPDDTPARDTNTDVTQSAGESGSGERGLERFFNDGPVDSTLGTVTETIERTKETIDTYRERRSDRDTEDTGDSEQVTEIATGTGSIEGDARATITRSRVEPDRGGLAERVTGVFVAIFDTFYSIVLWFLSFVLGFPALVELFILLAILILVYRLARRLGRRPIDS